MLRHLVQNVRDFVFDGRHPHFDLTEHQIIRDALATQGRIADHLRHMADDQLPKASKID